MANQQWQHSEFTVNGEQQAVAFLNLPLRQGAGEASLTLRNNGSAGLIWLEPGSLGFGTEQTWQASEFPAPNGAQDAVNFLNEPARQGAGEASATLRNDGSAGLIWLEPGSLGEGTGQAWEVAEFSGADPEQQAVNFLNAPPRQGAGEASVTPRGNGTVGLIYLEPGSLGEGTDQTWQRKDFPGPNGAQAVLNFLNATPAQGRGEATCFVRNDGSAAVFYLEPGTG
jgi:hypothetical protein